MFNILDQHYNLSDQQPFGLFSEELHELNLFQEKLNMKLNIENITVQFSINDIIRYLLLLFFYFSDQILNIPADKQKCIL